MKYDFFIGLAMSELTEEDYLKTSNQVKNIVERLKSKHPHLNVFCELLEITQDEYCTPVESCIKDFTAIDNSDHFIFYYPNKVNTSLMVECGYALAKNKPITIFVNDIKDLPSTILI